MCSITNQESNELLDKNGLKVNYCYQILNCYLIEGEGSNGIDYILKLQNPWGKDDWNGKWSNNSNAWTPKLRL